MQVLRMMNVLLDKHPQSRRRGLSFNTLSIIPVWPQVLVCDTKNCCQFCIHVTQLRQQNDGWLKHPGGESN